MRTVSTVARRWFGPVAGGYLVIFGSVALAADPQAGELGQAAASAEMQVATEGITHEEYLQRQEALTAWLTGQMPALGLDEAIGIELTPEEMDTIENALPTPSEPLKIGVVRAMTPAVQIRGLTRGQLSKQIRNVFTGVTSPTGDGGLAWALSIESTGAGAIRVHIEDLSLPEAAELYFYSPLGEAFGPYTGTGPVGTGDFWTESVFGTEGTLQLWIPGPASPADLRQVSLTVTEVGLISSRFTEAIRDDVTASQNFCGNPKCIVDASCFGGTPAEPAKNAEAKMEWISGPYIYTCSGGLLADNNPSQNNYFLTANHCINKNSTAQNVQFYWRFRTSSCNGACPSNSGWPFKTTGSTLRKTGRKGDFTLLQLNSNPPSGSVFLGWTSAPVAFSNGTLLYRISNPNFGPQVYSKHHVDTSAPVCSGWPRGERIYSRDDVGGIDGGSSGSPVVNGSSQVVGQLSGTCGYNPNDPCDEVSNATVDGAFAYYYAQIQPFINP